MYTIWLISNFFLCYAVGRASSSWAGEVPCRRPGLHCNKDCTALEMCIFDDGNSSSSVVEYCDDNHCHSPPGECSPEPPGPPCTFQFSCQSDGQFPHPYDCTQFCTCNGTDPPACSPCEELGTAYSAASRACDADLNNRACTDTPVPVCEVPMDIHPLAEDPSIYYVCLPDNDANLQPHFFTCLEGNEFDVETKQCSTFKCSKPGFFPDPKNCSNYYYCSPEYLPILYPCPNNTIFNSTSEKCIEGICLTPEDPKRCEEGIIGIFADEKDCTMYYVCSPDLILSHVKCPGNTHFNSGTRVCEDGPCEDTVTTTLNPICPSPGVFPDPDDCTKFYFCLDDGTLIHQTCGKGHFDAEEKTCVPGSCPTQTEPTTIPTTSPPPFNCPSPGAFPDPDDCTKFYFCLDDGTKIHQTCGRGHFDAEDKTCVDGPCSPFTCPSAGAFPDSDDCTKFYFCLEEGSPIHQTCDSGHFDAEEKTCVPGLCSSNVHCTVPGYFQYPQDCNTYLICHDDLIAIEEACPTGHHFDTFSQICVEGPCEKFTCLSLGEFADPDDCTMYYFCLDNGTQIHQKCKDGHYDAEEKTCVPGTCPTQTETTTIPTTSPPPLPCSPAGVFPDPENCTNFYFCLEDGTLIYQTCGKGHFDAEEKTCVPGSCPNQTETTTIPTTSPPPFTCPSPGAFPDPDDCTKYYFCLNNGTQIHQACVDGHFDAENMKCVSGPCTLNFQCTVPGYFPNPQNCTTYFICFDDLIPKQEACPSGYHFDAFSQICVEGPCPKFTCPSAGAFPDPNDCTMYYFCLDDGTHIHQACVVGHFDAENMKCVSGPCSLNFQCTVPGYFPNPENCTTYFICLDDLIPKQEACPSGYHFDAFSQICVEGQCKKSASETPFLCTIRGVVTDPDDCSKYYICTDDLAVSHEECFSGYHFDATASGCVVGSCSN